MSNVINMREWKLKKESKQDSVKQVFRDSLDNDAVKQRYKIKEPTIEERTTRISESIKRINKLMKELENTNK